MVEKTFSGAARTVNAGIVLTPSTFPTFTSAQPLGSALALLQGQDACCKFATFVLDREGQLHCATVRNPSLFKREIADRCGGAFLIGCYADYGSFAGRNGVSSHGLRDQIRNRIECLPFQTDPRTAVRDARQIAYREAMLRPLAERFGERLARPLYRAARCMRSIMYRLQRQ